MSGMDASPTARALRTLDLIHQRPGIRAEELADRLGVSERAVRRYVGTLREAGIPTAISPSDRRNRARCRRSSMRRPSRTSPR